MGWLVLQQTPGPMQLQHSHALKELERQRELEKERDSARAAKFKLEVQRERSRCGAVWCGAVPGKQVLASSPTADTTTTKCRNVQKCFLCVWRN